MTKIMTKKDAERKIMECVYACQRLYNISARGLWNEVVEAGMEVVNTIADNARMTTDELNSILKPAYGNMYAIAGYDD